MLDLRHENDLSTLRANGRKFNESRTIHCELGTMQNTSGSAIFTIGNTKVAAFLEGPHQVSMPAARRKRDTIVYLKCAFVIRLRREMLGRLLEDFRVSRRVFSTSDTFRPTSQPWSIRRTSRKTRR